MQTSIGKSLTGKRLIGLTGNIATGKSTVQKMLAQQGAIVIDADAVARAVVQPGLPALDEIVRRFGSHVLQANGALDRRALAAIVFNDPEKLRVLEGITHPAVRTEVTNRIAELPRGVIVVLEAIKLLESGWSAHCEEIWVVMCSAEKQLQRLIHTRGMTEQEARMRIDAQPPQAEKLAAADVVIDSNETIEQMQARINTEWRRFTLQSGHA